MSTPVKSNCLAIPLNQICVTYNGWNSLSLIKKYTENLYCLPREKPGHQVCNTIHTSWSKLGRIGVSGSCSQIMWMKGKLWWMFHHWMSCLYGFFWKGGGMELQANHATSGHIKGSEAIQSYEKNWILIVFPHGPHQHYYCCADAAPKRWIEGRLSKIFTVSVFYLLNITLFLHEFHLYFSIFLWHL